MDYGTPQEEFWAGEFGTDYIARNESDQLLASNLRFFGRILERTGNIGSCVELGANVGMNLKALKLLVPQIHARAVEINPEACEQLRSLIGADNVFEGSLLSWPAEPADVSFTKGVLIHVQPEMLPTAYDRLYAASHRYVLIAEYYSPSPVAIPYRGHTDRLFKRDFAGEMLERFSNLRLVDYGFAYRRDPLFPQDDINWFLMEKH